MSRGARERKGGAHETLCAPGTPPASLTSCPQVLRPDPVLGDPSGFQGARGGGRGCVGGAGGEEGGLEAQGGKGAESPADAPISPAPQFDYEYTETGERLVLGKGTYGVVYAGRDRHTRVRIAIKEIPERDSRCGALGVRARVGPGIERVLWAGQ